MALSDSRVLVVGAKQETATGNPVATTVEDFEIATGAAAIRALEASATEVGGALDVFNKEGVRAALGTVAWACSGGTVDRETYRAIRSAILDDVSRHSASVGGVLVVMHGAMVAHGCADPEGDLLREIRACVGTLPVVATLDLHAVLTPRMIRSADVLVPLHTYPHTDHFETGRRAARRLLAMMQRPYSPVSARVRLPMLARGDELLTATGLLGHAVQACQAVEASATGLSAGVYIGNPYTDVASLASNVLVTTDGDVGLARRASEAVASLLWSQRDVFRATPVPLDDALPAARARQGLTVLSDAADATSSGAPGDSNHVLAALLASRWPKRALLSIVDPAAAAQAAAAGVGATIRTSVGGRLDPRGCTPIDLEAEVRFVSRSDFVYEDGTIGHVGIAAVLRVGRIDILVTARRVWVVGQAVFKAHELDPVDYDLVVVKSPNGFRPHYADIAAAIVVADTNGCTSVSLEKLSYRHLRRPMFPWDDATPSLRAELYWPRGRPSAGDMDPSRSSTS